MSRWLIKAATNEIEYKILRKYIDTDPYDIPAGEKSILLADPLICAEFANYYENKNNSLLPNEWYNSIHRNKDASDLYYGRGGLLQLYSLPENKQVDLSNNEDVTKHD